MRRHDLHVVLVEDVLDVPVQLVKDFRADHRTLRRAIGDQAVLDVVIVQRGLANHRPGFPRYVLGAPRLVLIWERSDEYLGHVRDYFQQIGFEGVSP